MTTRNIYVQSEIDIPERITVHVIENGDDDGVLFIPESKHTCTIESMDSRSESIKWRLSCGYDVLEDWYPNFCSRCGAKVLAKAVDK